jgi:hypothetical protein
VEPDAPPSRRGHLIAKTGGWDIGGGHGYMSGFRTYFLLEFKKYFSIYVDVIFIRKIAVPLSSA